VDDEQCEAGPKQMCGCLIQMASQVEDHGPTSEHQHKVDDSEADTLSNLNSAACVTNSAVRGDERRVFDSRVNGAGRICSVVMSLCTIQNIRGSSDKACKVADVLIRYSRTVNIHGCRAWSNTLTIVNWNRHRGGQGTS
jgi:hypothetical protein